MLLRGAWIWDKPQKKSWPLDVQNSILQVDTDLRKSLNDLEISQMDLEEL